MNRLLVVIGVAALAWIAVIVTILLLVTALGWGEQQEPTTWREPPWFPPDTMNVTVERDCSMEHGLYKKMCETGALPD